MGANPEGHNPSWWKRNPEKAKEATIKEQARAEAVLILRDKATADRRGEFYALAGFAFTVASWGWTVIAPDSSVWFGSALLLMAVVAMLLATFRLWKMPKYLAVLLAVVLLSGFGAFDWSIVIKPQRGKEFKGLLVEGYHMTAQCSAS